MQLPVTYGDHNRVMKGAEIDGGELFGNHPPQFVSQKNIEKYADTCWIAVLFQAAEWLLHSIIGSVTKFLFHFGESRLEFCNPQLSSALII